MNQPCDVQPLTPHRSSLIALGLALLLAWPSNARADRILGCIDTIAGPEDVEVSHDSSTFYVSLAAGSAEPFTGMGPRVLRFGPGCQQFQPPCAADFPPGLTMMAIRPYVLTSVPPSPQDRLYVVNATGQSIEVFSLAPAHLGSILLGCTPRDVNFDPSGNRAYVSCSTAPRLKVIDVTLGAVGQVVQSINLDGVPYGLTVTNRPGVGVRVYVAIEQGSPFDPHKIAVVDPWTGLVSYFPIPPPPPSTSGPAQTTSGSTKITSSPTQSAAQPLHVTASRDGSKIFVSLASHQIFIFDASNPTGPFTQIFSHGQAPLRMATVNTPSGERVYVADTVAASTGQYFVTRINVANQSRLGPLQIHPGKNPRGIAGSPDGTRVYVTTVGGGTCGNAVTIIDTTQPDLP